MASRNERKIYVSEAHYHVYNRGVNGIKIFNDASDYRVFLSLLKRHLSKVPVKDARGREYYHFAKEIKLEAYCLMPNHFHLLLYQIESTALPRFLRAVMTPYVSYFNKKYNRFGPLFQGVYKASLIYTDSYLEHISRYIHLNPAHYQAYEWSSYQDYVQKRKTDWLQSSQVSESFKTAQEYVQFMADYKEHKAMLDEIKHELADQKDY